MQMKEEDGWQKTTDRQETERTEKEIWSKQGKSSIRSDRIQNTDKETQGVARKGKKKRKSQQNRKKESNCLPRILIIIHASSSSSCSFCAFSYFRLFGREWKRPAVSAMRDGEKALARPWCEGQLHAPIDCQTHKDTKRKGGDTYKHKQTEKQFRHIDKHRQKWRDTEKRHGHEKAKKRKRTIRKKRKRTKHADARV